MARAPVQTPLSGKALVGRFVVLEAFVVALGASELAAKPEDQRTAFLDELRKDARARASVFGHNDVVEESDDYIEETIEAMIAASKT